MRDYFHITTRMLIAIAGMLLICTTCLRNFPVIYIKNNSGTTIMLKSVDCSCPADAYRIRESINKELKDGEKFRVIFISFNTDTYKKIENCESASLTLTIEKNGTLEEVSIDRKVFYKYSGYSTIKIH